MTNILKPELYNKNCVSACRRIAGEWKNSCWNFPEGVEKQVSKLKDFWNSPVLTINIKAKKTLSIWCDGASFCGYTVARAFDRDGGAKLECALLSGTTPTSGGSAKNWRTIVYENSVFCIKVNQAVLDKFKKGGYPAESENWEIVENDATAFAVD